MMGKTHMAVGAAAYAVVVPPPDKPSITELVAWLTGLAVCIIAAIAADVDDPKTYAGKLIMPFIPRWLRPTAFAVVGILAIWHGYNQSNQILMLIGFGFFGAAISRHRNSPTHSPAGLLCACVVVYIYSPMLLIPILTGYSSHLIIDAITEGIPWAWPLPGWFKIPLFKTGGFFDVIVFRYGAVLVFLNQIIGNDISAFF
ncbi:hypothetical protein BHU72_14795 [Desulfuribacillus stibiiarsenatis]|uniref:Metal-dependent hydrolase n=1 Tax=Desulfuribacillus stibiiarsenatis TaxID=1390249 RepID=A0A1E5L7J8_9FIRM|nr:metal-dependent hydrolase [Desulfuribacillus stibiiarsenatis]OEH86018.1 hypothetical protein BHU72_14795 [Desulfuribacillus stibiiarsenatis]